MPETHFMLNATANIVEITKFKDAITMLEIKHKDEYTLKRDLTAVFDVTKPQRTVWEFSAKV